MKTVYIPTEKELYYLQNAGANIYLYLLAKTIETIIMDDVVYENDNMLDIAYDNFSEYPEIIYSIAKMYPEKIIACERAINDTKLCSQIISTLKLPNSSVYGLDYMTQFSEDVLQQPEVIKSIIKTVSNLLPDNPRYRFEYKEPNSVLDDLFACETRVELISPELIDGITYLEPAYYARLEQIISFDKKNIKQLYALIERSVIRYAIRYGIEIQNYSINRNFDVLSNSKAKKLVRYLEEYKQTISQIRQ